MSKKRILTVVVTFVLAVTLAAPASAMILGFAGRGVIVPFALYDDSGVDTVVGLFANPEAGFELYWSFFDANGNLLADGDITLQNNLYDYSFTLGGTLSPLGIGAGEPGYLIFTWDDNGILEIGEAEPGVFGAAFQVNLNSFDAAFIPAIGLSRDDYDITTDIDLLNLSSNYIEMIRFGNSLDVGTGVRFIKDPTGGTDQGTDLIILTPGDAPNVFLSTVTTTDATRIDNVQIPRTAQRLNIIDVASISGIPGSLETGTIIVANPLSLPPSSPGSSDTTLGAVFGLSRSNIVGAQQTILGTTNPNIFFF